MIHFMSGIIELKKCTKFTGFAQNIGIYLPANKNVYVT